MKRGAARFVGVALIIKAISHKARCRNIKRCEQRRQLETNLTQLLLEKVIFHFKEQIEFPASDERRKNLISGFVLYFGPRDKFDLEFKVKNLF